MPHRRRKPLCLRAEARSPPQGDDESTPEESESAVVDNNRPFHRFNGATQPSPVLTAALPTTALPTAAPPTAALPTSAVPPSSSPLAPNIPAAEPNTRRASVKFLQSVFSLAFYIFLFFRARRSHDLVRAFVDKPTGLQLLPVSELIRELNFQVDQTSSRTILLDNHLSTNLWNSIKIAVASGQCSDIQNVTSSIHVAQRQAQSVKDSLIACTELYNSARTRNEEIGQEIRAALDQEEGRVSLGKQVGAFGQLFAAYWQEGSIPKPGMPTLDWIKDFNPIAINRNRAAGQERLTDVTTVNTILRQGSGNLSFVEGRLARFICSPEPMRQELTSICPATPGTTETASQTNRKQTLKAVDRSFFNTVLKIIGTETAEADRFRISNEQGLDRLSNNDATDDDAWKEYWRGRQFTG
ncbi:MAG: hypothetical protein Q9188_007300 [Gyalolechia gomerana]